MKVTAEEELALLARARDAGVTVARLMVESALSQQGETATDRRDLAFELFGAFRKLSAISVNINQMAKATNATGEVRPEFEVTMQSVRILAQRISTLLDKVDAR